MRDESLDPIILTAKFDVTSQRTFQTLRDRYYPAPRNVVPAHLTLFHKLPQVDLVAFDKKVAQICQKQRVVPFESEGLRFLGNGVAIALSAGRLCTIRQELAVRWGDVLSPQDKQAFRPHVTIQNKVQADEARETYQTLSTSDLFLQGTVIGLTSWLYRSGPWEHYRDYVFCESA